MNKLFLFILLCYLQRGYAQSTPCVAPVSYSLTYQSSNGGNCTFLFTPILTVNQMGSSVKLARYTFTAGSTVVTVCYSGNPAVITNCSGPFSSLPSGDSQKLPSVSVTLPCGNASLVLTGSTSAQGTSTCATQLILNGPLPVELITFAGSSKTNGIQLNWATEWESRNDGFEVQKSKNAQSFEGVGFVKGNATTSGVSTYSFMDQDVQPGQLYYYRLKQKDIDGASSYSRIIAVRHKLGDDIPATVFPNANSGGSFMLSMQEAQSATVSLFTEAGVEIPVSVSKTGDPNLVSISSRSLLPKGVYLLKALSADKSRQTSLKVLVQ